MLIFVASAICSSVRPDFKRVSARFNDPAVTARNWPFPLTISALSWRNPIIPQTSSAGASRFKRPPRRGAVAAMDGDDLAGDVVSAPAGQKDRQRGDIGRLSKIRIR